MNVIGTLPKFTYDISVSASSLAACIESSVSELLPSPEKLLLVNGGPCLYLLPTFSQGGTRASRKDHFFTPKKEQFFGAIHAPELSCGIRLRPNTKL